MIDCNNNNEGSRIHKLNVRIPHCLYIILKEIADEDDRSVNYIVKKFLEKCVHAFQIQKNFEAERARNEEEL